MEVDFQNTFTGWFCRKVLFLWQRFSLHISCVATLPCPCEIQKFKITIEIEFLLLPSQLDLIRFNETQRNLTTYATKNMIIMIYLIFFITMWSTECSERNDVSSIVWRQIPRSLRHNRLHQRQQVTAGLTSLTSNYCNPTIHLPVT